MNHQTPKTPHGVVRLSDGGTLLAVQGDTFFNFFRGLQLVLMWPNAQDIQDELETAEAWLRLSVDAGMALQSPGGPHDVARTLSTARLRCDRIDVMNCQRSKPDMDVSLSDVDATLLVQLRHVDALPDVGQIWDQQMSINVSSIDADRRTSYVTSFEGDGRLTRCQSELVRMDPFCGEPSQSKDISGVERDTHVAVLDRRRNYAVIQRPTRRFPAICIEPALFSEVRQGLRRLLDHDDSDALMECVQKVGWYLSEYERVLRGRGTGLPYQRAMVAAVSRQSIASKQCQSIRVFNGDEGTCLEMHLKDSNANTSTFVGMAGIGSLPDVVRLCRCLVSLEVYEGPQPCVAFSFSDGHVTEISVSRVDVR
jgi:hypothetical protein